MLIHNAIFWLRNDLTASELAIFDSEIRRLARIFYLEHGHVGTPASTEPRDVTDHSFSYATSLHFRSLVDHEFYQTECPDHAHFVATCKTFWDRVTVYDIALH